MEDKTTLQIRDSSCFTKPYWLVQNNVILWKTQFWEVWEPLPLDVKITWIAFVSQTIAVITVIELFLLKK